MRFVCTGLALALIAVIAVDASGQRSPKGSHPGRTATGSGAEAEIAVLVQSGRLDEAETLARSAALATPRNASVRMLLAVALDQKGQIAEAEKEYRAAITLDPHSPSARVNLGVMLARNQRTAEALQVFEEAIAKAPNHQQTLVNLGLLYSSLGKYRQAIPLLESALKQNGSVRQAADIPILFGLVRAYLVERRTTDALRLGAEIEPLVGDDPRALYTLGLQFAEGQQYERAAALFERTDRLRPNTGEVKYNLGVALYNLDRLNEAARVLEAASELMPRDADPFYRLGLIASAKGDSATALGYWQKAISLRATHADAYFMMAEELAKNHREASAVDYYEKAIFYNDSKLIYYVRLGANYFRRRQYQQARDVYDRAALKYRDATEIHYLVGYAARAQGLYDEALASFQRAIQLEPRNVDVLANLGFIYNERGETASAEKYLREALALNAKHYPANYDLGRLLVRQKRYDEALVVLNRGASLSATDPGIHYQLFTAYSRLKRKADADRELAIFKRLEESRKRGDTSSEGSAMSEQPVPTVTALPENQRDRP